MMYRARFSLPTLPGLRYSRQKIYYIINADNAYTGINSLLWYLYISLAAYGFDQVAPAMVTAGKKYENTNILRYFRAYPFISINMKRENLKVMLVNYFCIELPGKKKTQGTISFISFNGSRCDRMPFDARLLSNHVERKDDM